MITEYLMKPFNLAAILRLFGQNAQRFRWLPVGRYWSNRRQERDFATLTPNQVGAYFARVFEQLSHAAP
jgi:hypothetical protein